MPLDNGTVLPPLAVQHRQWSRGNKMGMRVFQRTPSSGADCQNTFQWNAKVSKKVPELAAIGRSEGLMMAHSSDPLLRVTQLEQNIRFLQEQHQLMLASLHQEIEQLRQRNRDLQFQLVFTKGGVALVQSSPSSPEDDSRPKKILLSPKQFNLTPLQVEILERDITELKISLNEAKTKNHYLSGIVEEQKKKLEKNEKAIEKLEAVGRHISPVPKADSQVLAGPSSLETESESLESSGSLGLAIKLEEAEKLIRRLRRENDENKRELVTIKTNLSKSMGGGSGRQLGGGNNHRGGGVTGGNHHHRSNGTSQQQPQSHRFPPLHTQSYWHNGGQQAQHRGGMEYVPSRHCANSSSGSGLEKENALVGRAAPSLPNLRGNASSSGYNYSNTNNGNSHQRRGGYYNGNHYYRGSKEDSEGGTRKYRGGGRGGARGTRETRDTRETKE